MSRFLLGMPFNPSSGYTIENAALFDGSADYLQRTPGIAGNRKTWTISAWVKQSDITSKNVIIGAGTSLSGDSGEYIVKFSDTADGDQITAQTGSTGNTTTSAVYRDPTAWQSVVYSCDTTQASNQFTLTVNGVVVTALSTDNDLTRYTDTAMMNNVVHEIGRFPRVTGQYFNGYMADVHFIDSAALAATSFGEFDDNGVWVPIEYDSTAANLEVYSTGDRSSSITVTDDVGNNLGTSANLVDGTFTSSSTYAWAPAAGATSGTYVRFDLGDGNDKAFDLAVIYFSGTATTATAKWQGSNNASSWTDLGSTFTFYDAVVDSVDLSNSTSYRYYQIVGVSGNWENGTWIQEVEFRETTRATGHGTNGFHLNFADSTNLGLDVTRPAEINGGAYTPVSVRKDTSTQLLRGADLTGSSDVDTCTFSMWIKWNSQADIDVQGGLFQNLNGYVGAFLHSDNTLRILGYTSGTSQNVDIYSYTQFVPQRWYHIVASWDISAGTAHLYINGRDDKKSQNLGSGTQDWTRSEWAVGSYTLTDSQYQWGIDMADFILDNTYIDLSSASNLAKFITTDGDPVDPGSDGSTAIGSQPLIYLNSNSLGTWHTNAGTGGGFTETGALTAGDAVGRAIIFNDYAPSGSPAQVTDAPTDSATDDIGNYATWNAVNVLPQTSGSWAYTNGNLTATISGEGTALSTISASAGKYYWEINDGTQIIGIALNLDDNQCTWYKANSAQYTNVAIPTGSYVAIINGSSATPRLGIGIHKIGTISDNTANPWAMAEAGNYIYWSNDGYLNKSNETDQTGGATFANVAASTANFGQTAFTYTPPTGFKPFSTANLPAPAITDPSAHFQAHAYTGWNTAFQCDFDGSDAATSATDDSGNGQTITFNGNAQLDTAEKKFGSASLLLDGTGDYLSIPNHSDFTFNGTDWTFEAWVWFDNIAGAAQDVIASCETSLTNRWRIHMDWSNSGYMGLNFTTCTSSTASSWGQGGTDTSAWANNTWYHIVAEVKDGTREIYVNGVASGTVGTAYKSSYNVPTASLFIGKQNQGSTYYFEGQIDDVRITAGKAVYGAAFTPPASAHSAPGRAVTLTDVSGGAFAPDLVWIKNRDEADPHNLTDAVRGPTIELSIAAEAETTQAQGVKSFDSSGFTLGTDLEYNTTTEDYIAWCWKAGGEPTASNSATGGAMAADSVSIDGALESSYTPVGSPSIYPTKLSINTTAGFSMGTYTGDRDSAQTVPHGLSSAPELLMILNRDSTNGIPVYVEGGTPTNKYVHLHSGVALQTDTGTWNNTAPTPPTGDSAVGGVFSVGDDGQTNNTDNLYAFYAWHSVEGYSKIGTYEGASGAYIHCGFRPGFLLVKSADNANGWMILDSSRETYNPANAWIAPNEALAETPNAIYDIDFLSNGFCVRGSWNGIDTDTICFMAFAESPFGGSGVAQARAR